MNHETLLLVDAAEHPLAEIKVTDEENGWFYGEVLVQDFSPKLREALAWYDEVVEHQMLSYFDEALASVERFELKARDAKGASRPIFSLQINKQNEVSFRTTPIPPAAWLSKSESAQCRDSCSVEIT